MQIPLLKKKNIGVFILAYKRLYHLKKTIISLEKQLNKGDKIFIFCDDHPINCPQKLRLEVLKVKKYLTKLKSNTRFKVIFRNKNFGMTSNWYFAYKYMYSKFSKVICLEDDIIIKKNFITFMYKYLNHYENNKKIMSISGFATPIELPKNYKFDCYLTKRAMSWGQGSWRRVWIKFEKIMKKKNHLEILCNKKNLFLLISSGEDLLITLTLDYLKFVQSIQTWWIWNILINNGYAINPRCSLIKNIGFDKTGTHSKQGEQFLGNNKKIKNASMMKNAYYSETINKLFVKKFKVKLRTFLVFKYLPIFIIKYLYLVKLILKK